MEHHPTTSVTVDKLTGSSPDIVILKVSGPLSIHNFFDFQNQSRTETAPVLIVDVSDVPYIDSAALGSLVGVHVSRGKIGKKYAIVGANDRLRNLFELTNIAQYLVTFPDVASAEAALVG